MSKKSGYRMQISPGLWNVCAVIDGPPFWGYCDNVGRSVSLNTYESPAGAFTQVCALLTPWVVLVLSPLFTKKRRLDSQLVRRAAACHYLQRMAPELRSDSDRPWNL